MPKSTRNRNIVPKTGRERTETLRKRINGLLKKMKDLHGLTGVSIGLCLYDHNKEEVRIETFGKLEKLKKMKTFKKVLIKMCSTENQM